MVEHDTIILEPPVKVGILIRYLVLVSGILAIIPISTVIWANPTSEFVSVLISEKNLRKLPEK